MTNNPDIIFTLAISMVGVFFGLLMVVIGWMGNKLYNKVDEIAKNLLAMASELHDRITGIDLRLTRVEAVGDLHAGRRDYDKQGQ